jgi:hypothetical protein
MGRILCTLCIARYAHSDRVKHTNKGDDYRVPSVDKFHDVLLKICVSNYEKADDSAKWHCWHKVREKNQPLLGLTKNIFES